MQNCGRCGLNFNKAKTATNKEAKLAFKLKEYQRVISVSTLPSDISKTKLIIACLFGGLFGAHYYYIGRIYRGLINLISTVGYFLLYYLQGNLSGYVYNSFLSIFACMFAVVFVFWTSDFIKICFNRFKVPVSLPYSK